MKGLSPAASIQATEQQVQNDTSAERVAFEGRLEVRVLGVGAHDLWRDEARRSAPFEQELLDVMFGGQAEIADLEVVWVCCVLFVFEHDVVGFEVAVQVPNLLQVLEASQDAAALTGEYLMMVTTCSSVRIWVELLR